jgi:hypothetical protein
MFSFKQLILDLCCRYLTISPVEFCIGDAVELQLSFVGIPISNNRYKVLPVLRAVTLLIAASSKVSIYIY